MGCAISRYVLRRLAQGIAVLIGVLVIVFLVGNMIGDPVALMLPETASQERIDALREELGFTDPLHVQFGRFLAGAVQGDFGVSLWQNVPALPLVLSRVPATFYLAAVTIGIAFPVAVLLGSIAALKPRSLVDRIVNVLALTGVSVVPFWLGLMLILIFPVTLGIGRTGGFGLSPGFVLLPALSLVFRIVGRLSQLTRSALLDEYSQSYIKLARAKGMSEPRVLLHALKNAALPVVTMGGDETIQMANGTVVIETVFAWPGIGFLFIQAINQRDVFLLYACVFVIAIIVVGVNLIVDLLYTYLNPKVRYGAK